MSKRAEHLIIQTAFLGDLLLGIPLFKELRRLRPDDKITIFCRKGLGGFLRDAELVDDVIEADKSSKASWRAAVCELKSRTFDWLFCPHESLRSLGLVYSLTANTKIGYLGPLRSLVFDTMVDRPMDLPEALRQLAMLEPIDADWRQRLRDFRSWQTRPGGQSESGLVPVPAWAEMRVEKLARLRQSSLSGMLDGLTENSRALALEAGLVGAKTAFLAPGSVWKTKMWTSDGFAQVASDLVANGFRVVLTGARDEMEICAAIAARAQGVVTIAGRTTLFESAELMGFARFLVCNDSGAMHLASAVGVPTVSIFGPTILDFGYRPWQTTASVLQVAESELSCRPCGTHGSASCPIGTHDCMKRISAERVLKAAMDVATGK